MIKAAAFWDRVAERYARSRIADLPAYLHTLEKTRGYLAPQDRVLELGCGTASTALELAGNVQDITASDISPKMIAIATRKAAEQGITNIRLIAGDVADPALGPGPYDAVLAFNLLHLVDDLPGALAHIHALIRPGGLFITKTICLGDDGVPLKVRLFLHLIPLMRLFGLAPDVRFFSVEQFDASVRAAGFEIIEAGNFPASPPRRYIVARKPQ
jgi:ubiquinone/menaquinone biosynthesis C-methylase UbiE